MEYIDILNKVGLKVTKSRSVVLSIFENADRILNVSEIYDVCRDRGFAINLSTIYRTCETFSEKRILDKVIGNDRVSGYRLSIRSHVHEIKCSFCNKIVQITCPFNILRQYIENNTGFTLTKHSIDIAGICDECKKTRANISSCFCYYKTNY